MKFRVTVEGDTFDVEIEDIRARPVAAFVSGVRYEVWPEEVSVALAAAPVARISTPASQQTAAQNGSGKSVVAPIPGVIESVSVHNGDTVEAGQPLCTLEAMKMKNIIRANRNGTIAEITVATGQQVNHGDVLMVFE
jgi:glutaconyl-CoA/methylmalonyl-CoA decarboxylase subunit gamma